MGNTLAPIPHQGVYRPGQPLTFAPSGLHCAPLRHICTLAGTPSAPQSPRFQSILGTLLSPPGDFRDHLPKFPKLSWSERLFFKCLSRILGGAKGRFCPVTGGGGRFVSRPVPGGPACGLALCPVWIEDRRRQAAKTGGRPARCRRGLISARLDLARVGWVYGDFQPGGIFSPSGPLFCPVACDLRPGGVGGRVACFRGPVGLVRWPCWPVAGLVGTAGGRAVSIWGGRRPFLSSGPVACRPV